MLWFYFTGIAILVGGEINSEIENEMAKQGAPDAKEKGEKSPDAEGAGQRRAGRGRPTRRGPRRRGETTASTSTSLEERPRARAARGRVTRVDADDEGFSLGKVAVVAAAWALSKVGIRTTDKTDR